MNAPPEPPPEPLHPNLAEVAAAHDDTVAAWRRGEIDADEANARLADLIARDDTGQQWRVSVETGTWQYRARDGMWYDSDHPPRAGVRTPKATDVSRPSLRQGHRVRRFEVDDDAFTAPGSLEGSTRRSQPRFSRRTAVTWAVAVTAVAVTAVAVAAAALLSS